MLRNLELCALAVGLALGVTVVAAADSPFAAEVLDFAPAPGQFVNVAQFNDPSRALGSPIGGGHYNPDNTKLVSLGGFGGALTLKFDHTVMDHATNPLGLDAIVFGNATWVGGDPNRHWAECGVIEISRDVNANGLADEPWYLIPGSHLAPPIQRTTQTWDDDIDDLTYPPFPVAPEFPHQNWIPPGCSGTWTTQGYRLPPEVFDVIILDNPNGPYATEEGIFGYADFSPVLILGDLDGDNLVDDPDMLPADFYTVPDDPWEVGLTPGCGGGDAFDIAWAVDPATNEPAELDGFDFIRITNGGDFVGATFGEVSPEIGGVADVRPGVGDMNCDGLINSFDIDPFVLALTDAGAYAAAYPECTWRNADVDGSGAVNSFDIDPFVVLLTGG